MEYYLDSLFCFQYPSNYKLSGFTHDTHELIYFLNGSGEIVINNQSYSYHGNTVCLLWAGDRKECISFRESEYLCIRFTGNACGFHLDSGVYNAENEQLYRLFKEINEENREKGYFYYPLCNLKITEILLLISRSHHMTIEEMDRIYQMIQQISENPCFSKTLSEMAEYAGYSYDHFRHKFKKITGLPPSEYILNHKIENAASLLKSGNYSCTEIAELCGFSSPSQFSVLFKKKTGISPNKYLRSSLKAEEQGN